jgi:hypothetical protein
MRVALNAIPRIVLVAVFWSYIYSLYRYISSFILSLDIYIIARLLIVIVSLASLTIAILFLNSFALAISLFLSILNSDLIPSVNILLYFTVIGALLIVDNVKTYYRYGQERYVRLKARDVLMGVTILVLLFGLVVIFPSAISYLYIDRLLDFALNLHLNSFAKSIVSNPLFLLAISLAIGLAIYRGISTAFEALTIYLFPSRNSGLKTLLNRDDIDIFFKPPFKTLISIIIASAVAPILYIAIADVLLYRFLESISLQIYMYIALKSFVAMAIFTAVAFIINRFEISIEFNPKPILATSITILVALYIAGFFVSFEKTGDVISSLISPDITYITSKAIDIYREYYAMFILFVDIIPKLFGVAP